MNALTAARSFRHGVHPAEHKEQTEHSPLQRMPFVRTYIVPLTQHIGAPCKPVVEVGDAVVRGETIAAPGGFVSQTLHAPVTGTVRALALRRAPSGQMVPSIEIDADPFSTQELPRRDPIDWRELSLDDFIAHVQKAGLVGMGGAAFPTHVKYKLPEGRRCERLVINGCECEPFLTCDHRVMVERAEELVRGVEILMTKLEADDAYIGVELNKPDAIAVLEKVTARFSHIHVRPLRVKYPQGAEKMLIKALFDEEVPAGKLPLDLNIVVNNVGTMISLAEYFDRGIPLIERAVTVAGPGVDRPGNLIVPIGTPVREVMRYCGLNSATREVVMGGPMMGSSLASLDVPVVKGTSGLLAFTESEVGKGTEYACVRCGQCLEACGNFLNPSHMARLARAGRYEELEKSYVMDCVECGACTYTCPSGVPIVHLIRAAKAAMRERKAKQT